MHTNGRQMVANLPSTESYNVYQLEIGKKKVRWFLVCLSALGMFIGFISATLLLRFYFSQGGSRRWLAAWVQTGGWPICAIIMIIVHRRTGAAVAPYTLKTSMAFIFMGSLSAVDNLLYSWGLSYLPASTAGLLSSSQLAFNSLFALLILRKRINAFGWNSIVLVTSSAIILALHSSSDKLQGVSPREYATGFLMTIVAAGLYGFILSLTELTFTRILCARSSIIVLQMQVSTAIVATMVCTIGMAIQKDFTKIFYIEANTFKAGKTMFYVTIASATMAWQAAFLGTAGLIFLSSSLLAGVVLTVVIPVGSIFAFLVFGDSFDGIKVMALMLSLWGFLSYLYGNCTDDSTTEKESTSCSSVV